MKISGHLIVLCGPTGVGKTKLAVDLAKSLDCEIISADSRQIYKEMYIGTAVPGKTELNSVVHHFIQSHSIHNYYNASMFEAEVNSFLNNYFTQNERIIMVGGSGLYIDAVCKGIDDLPTIPHDIRRKWLELFKNKGLKFLQDQVKKCDPEYYNKVDRNNPKRLLKAIEVFEITGKPYSTFLKKESKPRSYSTLKIGLNIKRDILYERINHRVDQMIKVGLIEEARALYPHQKLTPLNTVGYKELFSYFDGKIPLEEAIEQIKNHSRAYARKQITWFRRDPEIIWFEPEDFEMIRNYIYEKI